VPDLFIQLLQENNLKLNIIKELYTKNESVESVEIQDINTNINTNTNINQNTNTNQHTNINQNESEISNTN
jgi:hypothetical protein